MNKKSKRKQSIWTYPVPLYVFLATLLVGIITAASFYLYGSYVGKNQQDGVNRSHSMVQYLEETSEVVFLNVGIQNVQTQTNNTKIPWTKIGVPGSEKKAIIILNYASKLGIKEPVSITEKEENSYHITVPKFEFIGVELDKDNPYQLYDSSGGLLSAATKNIDTGSLVTKALYQKEQETYLEQCKENLKSSAETYYTSLFASIDPDITLTFTFEE